MTQAIGKEELLLAQFRELSPEQQQAVLYFVEFLQFQAQQQRKREEGREQFTSFLEAAKEFIGRVDGGPGDLATNKEYLHRKSK